MEEPLQHHCNVFMDLRGFTAWSETVPPAFLATFMADVYRHVLDAFPDVFWKTLGDGVMCLMPTAIPREADAVTAQLAMVLQRIATVETAFQRSTAAWTMQYGWPMPLLMGWGLTRGLLTVLHCPIYQITDYVGVDINKASRLCSLARPAGIVIDAADFPVMPDEVTAWLPAYQLTTESITPVRHRVRGIAQPLMVWKLVPRSER